MESVVLLDGPDRKVGQPNLSGFGDGRVISLMTCQLHLRDSFISVSARRMRSFLIIGSSDLLVAGASR